MAEAKLLFCKCAAEELEIRLMNGEIERKDYQSALEELADILLA